MPPKVARSAGKVAESRLSDNAEILQPIDVLYNPQIVEGLLEQLQQQVSVKCSQLQKDSDFMTISIQQAFHLELIKLPTQVKNMSLARFKEEFGESLEAVTRSAIGGLVAKAKIAQPTPSSFGSAVKSSRPNAKPFQTPSAGQKNGSRGNTAAAMRNPKEGEKIVSINGSPLGDFRTVVKAPKNATIVPPTPGVFIPLESGDVLDLDNLDVAALTQHHKDDAMIKMQAMMASIKSCMVKIEKSK